jgi:hypothetical protein
MEFFMDEAPVDVVEKAKSGICEVISSTNGSVKE